MCQCSDTLISDVSCSDRLISDVSIKFVDTLISGVGVNARTRSLVRCQCQCSDTFISGMSMLGHIH